MEKVYMNENNKSTRVATSVQIGENTIRIFTGGGIWIEKPDGEGMECKNEDLAKVIDDFFEREM